MPSAPTRPGYLFRGLLRQGSQKGAPISYCTRRQIFINDLRYSMKYLIRHHCHFLRVGSRIWTHSSRIQSRRPIAVEATELNPSSFQRHDKIVLPLRPDIVRSTITAQPSLSSRTFVRHKRILRCCQDHGTTIRYVNQQKIRLHPRDRPTC